MKRYLGIYLRLLRLNFATLTIYRSNFINSIFSSLSWGFFSLFSIVLLTSRTTLAYGFTREEILLFNGIYGVVIGFFHLIISVNMRRLSRVVRGGELDFILTKPIDSQWALSFWLVDYTMILRVLLAFAYTVWLVSRIGLEVQIITLLGTVIIAVVAIVLLYSLWFLSLTLLIWFPNLVNLAELLYAFESLARFPKEMVQQLATYLFLFLLPLTLIINTPTRLLLNKLNFIDLWLLLFLAVIFCYLSRKFWLFALRHYASVSS